MPAKMKKASKTTAPPKLKNLEGIIYLGHIPFGFFEPEIRKFFSQFGPIQAISLKRSKKTGNSKGYAFIQFKMKEIAEIASNAMDNYILFGRSLVCKVVDKEKAHPNLLKKFYATSSRTSRRKSEISKRNKIPDETVLEKRRSRAVKKAIKKDNIIKDFGFSISDTLCATKS